MLAFVPVTLDLYRTVKRHLHWTLQNLVAFADTDGRCFPSVRTLAEATGHGKSTVSRHLAQLAAEGIVTRQRRPGGVYAYVIAKRFLPAMRGVSHSREKGVPPAGTEEKVVKKTRGFAGFGKVDEGLPRATDWEPRMRGWLKRGFWLAAWGPRPNEPGCWAPAALGR